MKKKLLKPPERNGEILILPDVQELLSRLSEAASVAVAHQPYFFNPGVSVKFLLLHELAAHEKEIIFVDTDRIDLRVCIPSGDSIAYTDFMTSEHVLDNVAPPQKEMFYSFFDRIEDHLKQCAGTIAEEHLKHVLRFKSIVLNNTDRSFLKTVLTESFLQYYGIHAPYSYLSDIIEGPAFKKFFMHIYRDARTYRETFNTVLDEYRQEFRFRYKNFPFPKLDEGELPFWILHDGERMRCYENDISIHNLKRTTLLPRASTLTMFLRLYRSDFFIHGIGGANYEWVQDRMLERFFRKSPPHYAVASGTFLIENYAQRTFPYFLFPPETVYGAVRDFLRVLLRRHERY